MSLIELSEYEDRFESECRLISAVKCCLLENGTLEGYLFDGKEAVKEEDFWILESGGLRYRIEIRERMVMDYMVLSSW